MKCSGWWLIALSRMGLANVRHQPLARPLQRIPALGHMKCWDRDQLATVEANQCRIDQFTHFHHLGEGVDVDTGPRPNFGAGRCGQHRLYIDALGRQLKVQTLRQKQNEGFGAP